MDVALGSSKCLHGVVPWRRQTPRPRARRLAPSVVSRAFWRFRVRHARQCKAWSAGNIGHIRKGHNAVCMRGVPPRAPRLKAPPCMAISRRARPYGVSGRLQPLPRRPHIWASGPGGQPERARGPAQAMPRSSAHGGACPRVPRCSLPPVPRVALRHWPAKLRVGVVQPRPYPVAAARRRGFGHRPDHRRIGSPSATPTPSGTRRSRRPASAGVTDRRPRSMSPSCPPAP